MSLIPETEYFFSIYSNPAADRFFVKLTKGEILFVKIYSTDGKMVCFDKPTSEFVSIDVSMFSPSVYSLEIETINSILNGTVIGTK